VTDYAGEAASHGAVYLEGIFSPAERVVRGVDWDEIFSGYCEGAQEARERHGVEVRLTPDIYRGATAEQAEQVVRYSAKYRERGIVAVGLGGLEAEFPPEPYEPAFTLARSLGLASVPHAGEAAGPSSVRGALDELGADRIRHGIRSVEDAGLVAELAGRGTVLDVCPLSNLRTGVVGSLEEHPLPQLVAAGVRCSISTDDPAMFDTDLTRDYEAAASLGVSPARAAPKLSASIDFLRSGSETYPRDDAIIPLGHRSSGRARAIAGSGRRGARTAASRSRRNHGRSCFAVPARPSPGGASPSARGDGHRSGARLGRHRQYHDKLRHFRSQGANGDHPRSVYGLLQDGPRQARRGVDNSDRVEDRY
jgi:aminodeoxyfutalosine deaminase